MNFPRRPSRPVDPNSVESEIRNLVSNLRTTADNDTRAIIAGGTNCYIAAMNKFRGETYFTESDVTRLLTIWETLLDAGRVVGNVSDFAPKGKPAVEIKAEEPIGREVE